MFLNSIPHIVNFAQLEPAVQLAYIKENLMFENTIRPVLKFSAFFTFGLILLLFSCASDTRHATASSAMQQVQPGDAYIQKYIRVKIVHDENGDGKFDQGEPKIHNLIQYVDLYKNGQNVGSFPATGITNYYFLSVEQTGVYTASFKIPDGYTYTGQQDANSVSDTNERVTFTRTITADIYNDVTILLATWARVEVNQFCDVGGDGNHDVPRDDCNNPTSIVELIQEDKIVNKVDLSERRTLNVKPGKPFVLKGFVPVGWTLTKKLNQDSNVTFFDNDFDPQSHQTNNIVLVPGEAIFLGMGQTEIVVTARLFMPLIRSDTIFR
ncbi:hypothetical protein BH09PAT2_BH09PAT2_03440 [soil metagenome]